MKLVFLDHFILNLDSDLLVQVVVQIIRCIVSHIQVSVISYTYCTVVNIHR